MGRPYAKELLALGDTLAWAVHEDVGVLQSFVNAAQGCPLLAVGSGGSVAAAHYAALLHRHQMRCPSRHATPLELLLDEPGIANSAVMILSASGRNRDVLAAAQAAIGAEVRVLGSLSTRSKSPLADMVRGYGRGYAFAGQSPAGKDGYLATNSLLATLVLLARSYGADLGSLLTSPMFSEPADVVARRSAIVLHAGWSAPVSTDLESRLHESTLMNVQVCDYRNFGHGRHLWLSRRGEETLVVALVTPETELLAERTLKLVPENVPVVRMQAEAPGPAATIELLCKVLQWTGGVADLQAVDPGRPQVPQFGRRLFHVRPPREARTTIIPPVKRKLDRLNVDDPLPRRIYLQAFASFRRTLSDADIGAVALDYDGTLCTTRDRFAPLPEEMRNACIRLLGMGLTLGIATGRGRSVREALRSALPVEHWGSVLVGYYNGADMAPLTADDVPDKGRPEDPAITAVRRVIDADPVLAQCAVVEARPSQVTVSPIEEARLMDLPAYVLDLVQHARTGAHFLRSGHSIDIVAPKVSKLRVVDQLAEQVRPRSVLCIGDRGAWPGNDSHLLSHEVSLSVDQVSASLSSCWNLAPAGVLGPQATLLYLQAIRGGDGAVRLDVDQVMRGAS